MKCPHCGTQNTDDAKHCRRCGAVLPLSTEVTAVLPLPEIDDEGRTHPLGDEPEPGGTQPLHDTGPKSGPLYAQHGPVSDTRLLQRPRNFFEPLPERAILNEGRCLIRALQEESPLLNIYSALSRHALVECRQCGFARNNFGDQYCLQCGASLAGVEPNYPNFVVKETLAADAIAIERQLAEMELHHGGALLPLETFTEIIAGTRRVYVILPEPSPFTGESLPTQPELNDVINWGVQLADALAFLHKNNISFGAAHLNHMSISGKAARWFNFTSARIQTPGTRTRKAYLDDVQALIASLFVLLTGKTYSAEIAIEPAGLQTVFREGIAGEISSAAQLAERLRDVIAEIRRPSSYDLRVGRLTDVGHVRQLNEDSLLTLELGRVHRSVGTPIGLYVVADGMGGHSAGDVASGLAINALAQHAAATLLPLEIDDGSPAPGIENWLRDAINVANATVHEQRKLAGTNMGTTLVLAYVAGGQAYFANVGDSRGYIINESGIRQMTVDHSLVQRLVDTKQLTPEEAHHYPQKNVIYKNLGDRATVAPDLRMVELQPGDRLLLCSDGLLGWGGPVTEEDAQQIIMAAASPQEACRQLIDAANAAGGPDNITAIIVQMEPLG
ncbi:MAG TPA: Stp1/IreP family PP2C-type Ser/Thr phosphatase [Anaerolineae bacterium]|nr:Stp1/IreP family PP2C-type Ser/Thr phosphatase [Anaerolineae bacterium]